MGHYSDYYAYREEEDLKREKASLEKALVEYYEFRSFKPGKAGMPSFVESYFKQAEQAIKARLYDLRHY